MTAIAAQLSATTSPTSRRTCRAARGTGAKSALLPRREDPGDLPEGLQGIVRQVPHHQLPRDQTGRYYYANRSRRPRRGGQAAPRRLGLFAEVYAAKVAPRQPVVGGDALVRTSWSPTRRWARCRLGERLPEMLRNETGTTAGSPPTSSTARHHQADAGLPQAASTASATTFTLKQLADAGRRGLPRLRA